MLKYNYFQGESGWIDGRYVIFNVAKLFLSSIFMLCVFCCVNLQYVSVGLKGGCIDPRGKCKISCESSSRQQLAAHFVNSRAILGDPRTDSILPISYLRYPFLNLEFIVFFVKVVAHCIGTEMFAINQS